jgi:hypothetical protein
LLGKKKRMMRTRPVASLENSKSSADGAKNS